MQDAAKYSHHPATGQSDRWRGPLSELGDRLRDIDSTAGLAFAAAEILGRTLHVSRAGYGTIDPVAETVAIERDWNAPGIRTLAGTLHFRDYGSYIEDLKRGDTVVFADAYADPRTATTADKLKAISAQAVVNMPITEHGGFVALLYLNHESAREWSSDELLFIREVADRTRIAVERRRAEHDLRELAASLERLVAERTLERDRMWRLSNDIMVVARFDATITSVNPAWTSLLGWQEQDTVGRSFMEFVHPDDLAAVAAETTRLSLGHTTLHFESRYRQKSGGVRTLSWRAVPHEGKIHAVGRDVTAEKASAQALAQAEEQLRQSQKMEAIGKLTGGVAHDFNNLLQVISGNLQLLAGEVSGNERAERRVRNAMEGVARGSKLASQLLAFGRRQPLAPKVVNIGRFIRGMDDLLRRALGEDVELETIVAGGLWNTLIDPANVENALLNLAINARDAMEGRGRLTIEAGNASLDSRYAGAHDDVIPGQYVLLAVTDTGCGIPADVVDQVFEPFFTTKPEGRGTGLGLSMVYGFVKQSGGHIKIYSEEAQGTTIKLYLPRSSQSEDILIDVDTSAITGGHETILVAEDDDAVRETVVAMLGELGYRVLKSRDAQSALSIIESGLPIDLLFTDVVMPGVLKSPELARKARERLPHLAVLFTSGYTENAIVHSGRLDEGVQLLSKPYSRETLARKLRQVLAEQSSAAGAPSAAVAATPVAAGVPWRILVCEDDWLIRASMAELLESRGYRVLEAADATQALAVLAEQPFDLLLTDVGLPGRSGVELARIMRATRPDLAVLFATGRQAVEGIEMDGKTAMLSKPYGSDALVGAITRLLYGGAASAEPASGTA
jgi:PAS domain S-box-containing protein